MDTDAALRDVCMQLSARLDETVRRDSARLREVESVQKELTTLSARLTEMLENLSGLIGEHEKRICEIEKRPSLWFERIAAAAISSAVTAAAAALL